MKLPSYRVSETWDNMHLPVDLYKDHRKTAIKLLHKIVPSLHYKESENKVKIHNNQYNQYKPKVEPINKDFFNREFMEDEWLNPNDKVRYEEIQKSYSKK